MFFRRSIRSRRSLSRMNRAAFLRSTATCVITPGGKYDAEVRLDYDTVRHRITTAETLLKIRPTENFNFTVAQFSIDNTAVLPPFNACCNRPRIKFARRWDTATSNRRGWNAQAGISYDVKQNVLQNRIRRSQL